MIRPFGTPICQAGWENRLPRPTQFWVVGRNCVPSGCHLGPSGCDLAASRCHLGTIWCHPGGILRAICVPPGHLGAIWCHLQAVWVPSGYTLVPSARHLVPSGCHLGAIWAPSGCHLVRSGCHLLPIWVPSGAIWVPSVASMLLGQEQDEVLTIEMHCQTEPN